MKQLTLNLLHSDRSDIGYRTMTFNDGEPHIWIDEFDRKSEVLVRCRIASPADLFPLTVWRAYDPKYDTAAWQAQGGDPGISWTIDKEWCIGYAKSKGRVIRERQVWRGDIFAYVTRRGESEMIILD